MSAHLKRITTQAKKIYKNGRAGYSWNECIKKASASICKSRIIINKPVMKRKKSEGSTVRKVVKRMSGVEDQIGALKKGSRFLYHKGVQIEKMPIELPTKGKRKKKEYIFIVHSKVYHSLDSAKKSIK